MIRLPSPRPAQALPSVTRELTLPSSTLFATRSNGQTATILFTTLKRWRASSPIRLPCAAFSMQILGIFAALALSLSTIGIYGVLSYVVGQRSNEIGIRMALGAERSNILRLILGHGARMAAAGIAAGLLAALGLTRLMSGMLFGIGATDPLTFAAVSALLALVALTACYIPARRAMRVDPVVALRYE
jgi:ABC-type antimicrobial peptide transport system permease subunit